MNNYSFEEKKRIAEHVSNCPSNLSLAFELASKDLDRSAKSICSHYYKHMKKEERFFPSLGKGKNVKNAARIDEEVVKARLEKKLAVRGMVKSAKARADVLAIRKALRALNK